MSTDRYESAADRAIREAQERGAFDNLPGAGRPLQLKNPNDPDWWVKSWIEREQISMPLPPALALRKEAETLREEILLLRSEQLVRERVEDYNARVVEARRRPTEGPPILVRTLDVEQLVQDWRDRRRRR